ncbi:MAG: DEAD/DEAH box helicase [Deltaproteobacteria bacterium]|nr:MAG: DEAD/DEAH box helicase [Deltaproteobacteria bacterium]
MQGWWLPADQSVEELASIPLTSLRRFSHAARVWILAAKWAVYTIDRQQVVPSFAGAQDAQDWCAIWRVAPVQPDDRTRLASLAAAMPGVARCWPVDDADRVLTPGAALQEYLDAAVDGLLRSSSSATMPLPGPGPDWVVRLAERLGGPERRFTAKGPHELHLADTLNHWVAPALHLGEGGRPMVGFRLSEPTTATGHWDLSYHLFGGGGSDRVAASELASAAPEIRDRVLKMVAPQDTLLEALGRCARVFSPIGRSLTQRLPAQVKVDAHEAWEFLTHASLQLERAGYMVEVPAALSRVGHRRVRARMRVGVESESGGAATGTGLLQGIVNFRWEACLGDDTLTAKEFLDLASTKAPLVMHRGEWVAVDPEDVARLQALLGEGEGTLDAAEALRLALSGEIALSDGGEISAEVVGDGVVAQALEALRQGTEVEPRDLPPPEGLRAELRPYQQRGYAWLASVTSIGFGACLADDMGLGKTVQLLALVTAISAEAGKRKKPRYLVVCPTSVIGNWRREINRFAPGLRAHIHHGPSRAQTFKDLEDRVGGDDPRRPAVIITSYALARRDCDLLQSYEFDCLALDEAQNIKNPEAAQSQAVRLLRAKRRIALTGTPVENRLTELWSILDFLNPGLIGGRTAFKKTFAVPIERFGDEDAAELLRKVTGPFILRRVKTDPNIAPELPEKVESTRYCPLTREQAALYQATVDEAFADIAELEVGMKRRGRILAMITAIKQICNHPAHFLRDGKFGVKRSGKLTRFLQLLEEVVANDGHALVFTQYREMGDILETVLSKQLGEPIPFLHGGLTRQARERMVQDFQAVTGPPVMVVSLRAGGTGLNLTRANHVFHYDRWWNPAVEDQATDRAFRIGQTRDVTVHRMVSQGTMEEQIHQILEEKRNLAGLVVDAGETWLSELDDDTLRSLMTLGQDAVLEEAW